MIQANELRIGNYIEANGPVMEVKAIWSDRVELYLHGSEADNWDEDFEVCNGIPLTPELLEKCGFERMPLSSVERYRSKDTLFFIHKHRGKWFLSYYKYYPNEMESLHQLQNLYYSLTGTELNYIP